MDIEATLNANLISILELARLAPSVHNTQPWRASIIQNTVVLKIDPDYVIDDGDPTKRQSVISLGIFCESFIVTAESYGLKTRDVSYGKSQAILHFEKVAGSFTESSANVKFLRSRCTDRSIYKPAIITESFIQQIENKNQDLNATIRVVTDKESIVEIAKLTSRGISLALSNPNFRKELGRLLLLPWSNKKRGISVRSLYISPIIAIMEPSLMRLGIGIKRETRVEKTRWESASAIVIILADGDLMTHWFESGRAYLRASLAIEGSGLSQATSAAIVEASNYHEDIESLLNTKQRILAIMRVGNGRKKRFYSPRVDAIDLIT